MSGDVVMFCERDARRLCIGNRGGNFEILLYGFGVEDRGTVVKNIRDLGWVLCGFEYVCVCVCGLVWGLTVCWDDCLI